MTPWQYLAASVIALAHVVGGVTAFGSSLLSASVLVAIGGVETLGGLVPILALCGLVQAAMIARGGLRHLRWREVGFVLLCMGAALPFGRWFALAADPRLVRSTLGVLLLLGGVAPWLISEQKRRGVPLAARVLVLGLAGGVHGGFASGGTVLIPHMRLTHTDKDRFRATLAAIWVALNAGLLAMLAGRALLAAPSSRPLREAAMQAPFAALACLGAVVATWFGQGIARRLDEKRFRYVVAGAMVLAGALYLLMPFRG